LRPSPSGSLLALSTPKAAAQSSAMPSPLPSTPLVTTTRTTSLGGLNQPSLLAAATKTSYAAPVCRPSTVVFVPLAFFSPGPASLPNCT